MFFFLSLAKCDMQLASKNGHAKAGKLSISNGRKSGTSNARRICMYKRIN